MAHNRADGLETRRRLLDAAGRLFAEKGFRGAKTADICKAAGANVASVNYHFRSKRDLYVAAWRHEFERSIAAYPPDGGVPPAAPPEDRFRGCVRALVERFMDPEIRDMDIADKEMCYPTGLLAEVMHSSVEPLRRIHRAIVRELLGTGADETDVGLCEMSIHSQCFAALARERRRRRALLLGRQARRARSGCPGELNVGAAALAEHIARFSLAGLREARRSSGRPARRDRGGRENGARVEAETAGRGITGTRRKAKG